FRLDAAAQVVDVGVGRSLERDARTARLVSRLQLNREVAHLGREIRASVFPFREHQAGDVGEVVDLPLQVRRLERRVADPSDGDAGALRSLTGGMAANGAATT